jgi:hypothetical protein
LTRKTPLNLAEFKLNPYYIQMWGCTVMNLVKKFTIFGSVTISSLAIAQSVSARFVIFVVGNDYMTLQKVRMVSPSAFATKLNGQSVVQAGIFNSENSADTMALSLQQSGLSAQKYFRSAGGKENDVQVPFSETSIAPISPVVPLPSPQQVVIAPQIVSQVETRQAPTQVFTSNPPQQVFTPNLQQQVIAYNNPQYQQITTVVPQIQTQQILVPQCQQVLVPETRQVVTQAFVPQTIQTNYPQGYTPTSYIQPQTGFIATEPTLTAPINSQNLIGNTTNLAVQQPTVVPYNTTNNQSQLPQATQNPNYRYVAAIPATPNNQTLLSRVRQYVPNAFLSSSGRGTYIHAGAYQNRDSAESVSRYLRSQGVESRVLYF